MGRTTRSAPRTSRGRKRGGSSAAIKAERDRVQAAATKYSSSPSTGLKASVAKADAQSVKKTVTVKSGGRSPMEGVTPGVSSGLVPGYAQPAPLEGATPGASSGLVPGYDSPDFQGPTRPSTNEALFRATGIRKGTGNAFTDLQLDARGIVDPSLVKTVDAMAMVGDVAAMFLPFPGGKAKGVKKGAGFAKTGSEYVWTKGGPAWAGMEGSVQRATAYGHRTLESLASPGTAPTLVKRTADLIKSNTKNIKLVKKIFKFSAAALAAGGAWAGAVFLGKWGQAEGPEPVDIVLGQKLIPEAMRTGNWTAVDLATEGRNEILYNAAWQEAALWSPIAPFVGIPKKIAGAKLAAQLNDDLIKRLKYQQENGLTETDMWALTNAQKAEREKAEVDYFNAQALIREKELMRLRAELTDANNAIQRRILEETIAEWEAYAERQRKLQEQERIATANYWLEYNKKLLKIQSDNRPSKLNFGLI